MKKNPVILFRETDWQDQKEAKIAKHFLPLHESRATIPKNSLIIPRYSALPFYQELQKDCEILGSKLINSYTQHLFVAKMDRWYEVLKDFTPKTYFSLFDFTQKAPEGAYVLKGTTNSKKFSWKTHMFAKNKQEVGDVYSRLMEDGLISTQDIVIREYVPLKNYGTMVCGIPISHEFRCFMYKNKFLSAGYYWSNEKQDVAVDFPTEFLYKISELVSPHINFWVVDIAQTEKGEWIVIELNDGSMSGLSSNNPVTVYRRLKEEILNDA